MLYCILRITAFLLATSCLPLLPAAHGEIATTDYPSIQAAIDANPGRLVYLPSGDHHLQAAVVIRSDGTSLCGPGRLIMENPAQDIIEFRGADNVRIKDVTLARAAGRFETERNGIIAEHCANLVVESVAVHDNRGPGGGIVLVECIRPSVRNCLVQNYKAPAIDDRTKSPESGHAFKCIDGTGIKVFGCTGAQVIGNRIVESAFVPSPKNRDKYDLGRVTVIPAQPGPLTPKGIYEKPYTNNWHQGSGIIVSGSSDSRHTILSGNYIESAGQGLDIHADYVIVSNNIVEGAVIGMKAMHGSKHVIISNNQFTRVDLWGILLCPGSASHEAAPSDGSEPARGPNIDGGTVVTGNIISDFGFGGQYWNWESDEPDGPALNTIALKGEQLPDDPPLRDVIIANNIVYDTGRDKIIVEGQPQVAPPRYRYALWIDQDRLSNPQNIRVHNNIFHPGRTGISNIQIDE